MICEREKPILYRLVAKLLRQVCEEMSSYLGTNSFSIRGFLPIYWRTTKTRSSKPAFLDSSFKLWLYFCIEILGEAYSLASRIGISQGKIFSGYLGRNACLLCNYGKDGSSIDGPVEVIWAIAAVITVSLSSPCPD